MTYQPHQSEDATLKPVATEHPPLPCPSYGGECTYPNCGHFLDVSRSRGVPEGRKP
jgi:hypothetical protein